MDIRLVIGLSRDSDAGDIRAVLGQVVGTGWDCRIDCLSGAAVPTFTLVNAAAASPAALAGAHLGLDPYVIADQCLDAIRAVMGRVAIPLDQVLAVGLDLGPDGSVEPWEGMITARIADQTGVTTIAGFATGDRVAGGSGRPLSAVVDWMLAGDQRYSRLMLHVEGIAYLTVLPAATGPSRVYTTDTGPGVHMLDALAAAFSQQRQPIDARGTLAVQGRQLKSLVRHWAAHPFLSQEPPKVLNRHDFAGPFVQETVRLAGERGWSIADVLCTATHFVAACSADAVRQYLAKDQSLDQVVLVGRGTQSGFLLRLLHEQFAALGLMHVSLPKIANDSYEAVTAAVLGCLALDGVPSNLPAATGASHARLAAHLVPGSPTNWHRCVTWMQRVVKPLAVRIA